MKLIAHRGNLNGKNPFYENSPKYCQEAIDKGFDVEIDIWYTDTWWTGHHRPSYRVDTDFLKMTAAGPISKYGTRVPSALVAKCCAHARPRASNMSGLRLSAAPGGGGAARSRPSVTVSSESSSGTHEMLKIIDYSNHMEI